MAYDPAKVYFTTESTVDKILSEPVSLSATIAGGDPITPTKYSQPIPHAQGHSVIVNGMYSIDGTNYYPCGQRIRGAESSLIVGYEQFLICDMYANDTNVYVVIDNGFDVAKTVDFYFVLEALQ